MTKTLTELSEEYNDWCGKNDMDSFLKTQGYTDRRMLSADELLHELQTEVEEIKATVKVRMSQIQYLTYFCDEWREAEREHDSRSKVHAVVTTREDNGHVTVRIFPTFEEAAGYVSASMGQPHEYIITVQRQYRHMDNLFCVVPLSSTS